MLECLGTCDASLIGPIAALTSTYDAPGTIAALTTAARAIAEQEGRGLEALDALATMDLIEAPGWVAAGKVRPVLTDSLTKIFEQNPMAAELKSVVVKIPEDAVKIAAAEKPESIKAIALRLLGDGDAPVRAAALGWLAASRAGILLREDDIPALIAAAEKGDVDFGARAARLLEKVTHVRPARGPDGSDADSWRQWWNAPRGDWSVIRAASAAVKNSSRPVGARLFAARQLAWEYAAKEREPARLNIFVPLSQDKSCPEELRLFALDQLPASHAHIRSLGEGQRTGDGNQPPVVSQLIRLVPLSFSTSRAYDFGKGPRPQTCSFSLGVVLPPKVDLISIKEQAILTALSECGERLAGEGIETRFSTRVRRDTWYRRTGPVTLGSAAEPGLVKKEGENLKVEAQRPNISVSVQVSEFKPTLSCDLADARQPLRGLARLKGFCVFEVSRSVRSVDMETPLALVGEPLALPGHSDIKLFLTSVDGVNVRLRHTSNWSKYKVLNRVEFLNPQGQGIGFRVKGEWDDWTDGDEDKEGVLKFLLTLDSPLTNQCKIRFYLYDDIHEERAPFDFKNIPLEPAGDMESAKESKGRERF
jgi:hypothetical protein